MFLQQIYYNMNFALMAYLQVWRGPSIEKLWNLRRWCLVKGSQVIRKMHLKRILGPHNPPASLLLPRCHEVKKPLTLCSSTKTYCVPQVQSNSTNQPCPETFDIKSQNKPFKFTISGIVSQWWKDA